MSRGVSKGHHQTLTDRAKPVVRRAFSMQEADAQLIEELRVRFGGGGHAVILFGL